MLTLWIVLVVAVIFSMAAFAGLGYWFRKRGHNYDGDGGMVAFICCLMAVVAVIVIPIAGQQAHVLSIPPRIASLERTIKQQTELISIEGTLGQGLEGLEIKRTIQDTMRELNDLIARSEYIEVSPWWMFKVDASSFAPTGAE